MSRIIIKLIIVIVLFLSFVPEMYACDTVSIVLNYYGIVKPKSSSSYPYEAYLLATVTSGYANSWTVYPDSGVSCEIVECYSGGAGTGLCALYIESDTAGDYEVKIRATATSTYDQKTCNLVVNEVGSVLVMPTFATPGTDVTFTPTSSPSCSLGFLQWEGRYSEDGSSWSDYSSIGSSANPLVTSFSIPGFYQALAKNGENDEGKESVAVPVVQLNEVTVDANATNILGTDNWITGKDVNEFVIVEAIISPSIPDENVPDVLTWEGGIEFEDNNLKRKVSKSTSGTTTVTATVGTASDSVNIVVVEVEEIDIEYSTGNWDNVTDANITVLNGTKYDFEALPYPDEYGWPPSYPVWTYDGNAVGSAGNPDVEITFSKEGTFTLNAKSSSGDAGRDVYIKVIVPEPNQVSFVDNVTGEEHDIYGVTDPVWKRVSDPNNPASYTKGKKMKINANFWASDNLTYPTQVKVDGSGFTEDTSVSFQAWPSEITEHVSDSSLANTIGSDSFNITWTYKVTPVPDTSVNMASTSGPHKIYRVFGFPYCSVGDYTKEHLEKATTYASGGGPSSSSVCTTIQSHIHNNQNFIGNTGPNGQNGVWNILTPGGTGNKGDCIAHANLMKVCLKVLGINATYAFIADATNQPSEAGPIYNLYRCQTHNRDERRYFSEPDDKIWSYEGVCNVDGTIYDVACSTISGTYEYCKTVGNGIVKQWGYIYKIGDEWKGICDDQGGVHTLLP